MPFTSVEDLPKNIREFSLVVQRQYLHVFNSTFNKVLEETNNRKEAERRAFMAAHSVLKKRFKNKGAIERNSHADSFMFLVQDFNGFLYG